MTASWGARRRRVGACSCTAGRGTSRPSGSRGTSTGAAPPPRPPRGPAAAGARALDAVERAVARARGRSVVQRGDGRVPQRRRPHRARRLHHGGLGPARRRRVRAAAVPPPDRDRAAVLEDGRHVLYAAEGAARFAVARGFAPLDLRGDDDRGGAGALARRAREGGAGRRLGRRDGRARSRATRAAERRRGHEHRRPREQARRARVGRLARCPARATTRTTTAARARPPATARPCCACASRKTRGRSRCAARSHPEEAARAVIRTLARASGGTGGVILVRPRGSPGLARNTRTMTWAAAGERLRGGDCAGAPERRRRSGLVRAAGRPALRSMRFLLAVAQALRALDALGLERRGEPLVTLPDVPDCAVAI